jgi:hypothetical protein
MAIAILDFLTRDSIFSMSYVMVPNRDLSCSHQTPKLRPVDAADVVEDWSCWS